MTRSEVLGEDFIQAYLLHQSSFSECPAQPFSEPRKSKKLEQGEEKTKES